MKKDNINTNKFKKDIKFYLYGFITGIIFNYLHQIFNISNEIDDETITKTIFKPIKISSNYYRNEPQIFIDTQYEFETIAYNIKAQDNNDNNKIIPNLMFQEDSLEDCYNNTFYDDFVLKLCRRYFTIPVLLMDLFENNLFEDILTGIQQLINNQDYDIKKINFSKILSKNLHMKEFFSDSYQFMTDIENNKEYDKFSKIILKNSSDFWFDKDYSRFMTGWDSFALDNEQNPILYHIYINDASKEFRYKYIFSISNKYLSNIEDKDKEKLTRYKLNIVLEFLIDYLKIKFINHNYTVLKSKDKFIIETNILLAEKFHQIFSLYERFYLFALIYLFFPIISPTPIDSLDKCTNFLFTVDQNLFYKIPTLQIFLPNLYKPTYHMLETLENTFNHPLDMRIKSLYNMFFLIKSMFNLYLEKK